MALGPRPLPTAGPATPLAEVHPLAVGRTGSVRRRRQWATAHWVAAALAGLSTAAAIVVGVPSTLVVAALVALGVILVAWARRAARAVVDSEAIGRGRLEVVCHVPVATDATTWRSPTLAVLVAVTVVLVLAIGAS